MVAVEDRRRQLLDAAVRVFARSGYHACRVADIAKEAGVAYGLVYHYFRSKDEVLETIFRDTWGEMLAAIAAVERSDDPARIQVRRVVAIVLRSWQRDPDLIRVLVREITRSSHLGTEVEEIGQAFAALERIVRRGQERGEFRDDVAARLGSQVLYGALEQVLTVWVFERPPTDEDEIVATERAVTGLLCDGLIAAD
jgi:AcrR family transcriptional regulator